MSERPFERHYGALRCRRYLFDPVVAADQAPRPEGVPPEPPAQEPLRSAAERPIVEHMERPQ